MLVEQMRKDYIIVVFLFRENKLVPAISFFLREHILLQRRLHMLQSMLEMDKCYTQVSPLVMPVLKRHITPNIFIHLGGWPKK